MSSSVAVLQREELTAADLLARPTVEVVLSPIEANRMILHRIMAELNIRPFNSDSVVAYKEALLLEANKHMWWHDGVREAYKQNWFWNPAKSRRMLIATVLSGGIGWLLGSWWPLGLVGGTWFSSLVLSLLVAAVIPVKSRAEWVLRDWPVVDRVPEEVSTIASSVQEAYPETRLHEDTLFQETKPLDPFLVLSVGEGNDRAVAYVAVWDETGFVG